MCVDDADPAVLALSIHFKKVIKDIISGTLKQLPATSVIRNELKRQKKKPYFFTAQDCANLWITVDDVETKWPGERTISEKLKELKNKVNV